MLLSQSEHFCSLAAGLDVPAPGNHGQAAAADSSIPESGHCTLWLADSRTTSAKVDRETTSDCSSVYAWQPERSFGTTFNERSMRICTTKHGTSLKPTSTEFAQRGTDVPVGTLN